ncbi:CUGBP Elav-like family member 1 [Schistocerca gregaria]|uniref:CUGBP Elav-like family member 1 n=1 Tax=Schistocerca gregaria TaxID=7010 RepID=UPI00211E1B07|nr:CUGBP Elav-like family member 1 [Schistocerca gregaria]
MDNASRSMTALSPSNAAETHRESTRNHNSRDVDSPKLFVGQIPPSCTEADLRELFSRYGRIHELVVFNDRIGNDSKAGYGFVSFVTRKEADNAISNLNERHMLPGSHHYMQVRYAEGENDRLEPKLFVGRLPRNTTDLDLRYLFEPFGNIKEIKILSNATDGSCRGCGFIRMTDRMAALEAIDKLNDKGKIHDQLITVSFAETSKEKQRRRRMQELSSHHHSISAPYGQSCHYPSYYSPGMVPINSINMAGGDAEAPKNLSSVLQSIESKLSLVQKQASIPHLAQLPSEPINYNVASYPHQYQWPTALPANPMLSMIPPQANQVQSLIQMNSLRPGAMPMVPNTHGIKQEGPVDANLFVLHLPKEWRNQELYAIFQPYGCILSANVYIDKVSGESKCFGFVSYDNVHSAQAAIAALNGLQISGKRLKVENKRAKNSSM